jgi:hypothetical protein
LGCGRGGFLPTQLPDLRLQGANLGLVPRFDPLDRGLESLNPRVLGAGSRCAQHAGAACREGDHNTSSFDFHMRPLSQLVDLHNRVTSMRR